MGLDLNGRLVAHIDLDAFFVSVELLRRPELAGKSVVIAGSGPRAVVSTASYEARQFGVESGIPVAAARRLCPDGIFLGVDMAAYRAASAEVMERVGALGVPMERASVDEVYLELSGIPEPVERVRSLVKQISDELSLDASVGISSNKLTAKVCSDAEKPRGFVVSSPAEAAERFAASSPRLLPGIGPKTTERLREMGIETIAQLQERSEEELVERFGERSGRWLRRRSWFTDDAPVAERERKSISVEETFDTDSNSRREILGILQRQSERLAELLSGKELRAKTITIKVRHADFATATRAKSLSEPSADALVISETARELLLSYGPPRPVRLLGVRVSGLSG